MGYGFQLYCDLMSEKRLVLHQMSWFFIVSFLLLLLSTSSADAQTNKHKHFLYIMSSIPQWMLICWKIVPHSGRTSYVQRWKAESLAVSSIETFVVVTIWVKLNFLDRHAMTKEKTAIFISIKSKLAKLITESFQRTF